MNLVNIACQYYFTMPVTGKANVWNTYWYFLLQTVLTSLGELKMLLYKNKIIVEYSSISHAMWFTTFLPVAPFTNMV